MFCVKSGLVAEQAICLCKMHNFPIVQVDVGKYRWKFVIGATILEAILQLNAACNMHDTRVSKQQFFIYDGCVTVRKHTSTCQSKHPYFRLTQTLYHCLLVM